MCKLARRCAGQDPAHPERRVALAGRRGSRAVAHRLLEELLGREALERALQTAETASVPGDLCSRSS